MLTARTSSNMSVKDYMSWGLRTSSIKLFLHFLFMYIKEHKVTLTWWRNRNFNRQYNTETWIFPLYPSGQLLVFVISFSYYLRQRDGPVRTGRVPRGGENSQIVFLLYSSLTVWSPFVLFPSVPYTTSCLQLRIARVPGSKQMGTQSVLFLFWAPFVLSFLSTPFHAVTSPISKKEEFAKAGEIAVVCYGSTHKNTGIFSHWMAVFCANSNDPPE